MTATAIFIKHNDRLHIWRKHAMNPLHMVFKALLLLIPTTDNDVSTVIMSVDRNLNVIFSFCREINGEKKNFCLVTNPRKKLKYRMFTEVES